MASTECNQEEIDNSEGVNLDYKKKETLLNTKRQEKGNIVEYKKACTKFTFTRLKNKK